jgi:hypothetical protein
MLTLGITRRPEPLLMMRAVVSAVGALARKLAGIHYAMWRDSTSFAARAAGPDEVRATAVA